MDKYFAIGRGRVPIILSCPHGGFKKPKDIPNKLKGVHIADKNKYLISKQIIRVLKEFHNIEIFYILSKIHRSKIDLNRPPRSFSAFNHNSEKAKQLHHAYHKQIEAFYDYCIKKFNYCLFIDLHGFTKPHKTYPDIIFGHIFGHTLKLFEDLEGNNKRYFWGFSEMIDEILDKNFTLDDGRGITDFNLAYSGGYITHRFYKKAKVNAYQLEVARYIREDIHLMKEFIDAFVSALLKSLKNKQKI